MFCCFSFGFRYDRRTLEWLGCFYRSIYWGLCCQDSWSRMNKTWDHLFVCSHRIHVQFSARGFSVYSPSAAQECVCASSKSVRARDIRFGSFPGYAFSSRSHTYSKGAQPPPRKHTVPGQRLSNSEGGSSSRRCHGVTSSARLAVSRRCPPLGAGEIFHQSSSCDAAASLKGPDRQCSRDDSPEVRAQGG